jgi:hypothetical protein
MVIGMAATANTPPSSASGRSVCFQCWSCGRCCDAPPRLSLPELYRHADHFVGALAVVRLAAGADAQRWALFDRVAFRAPLAGGTHIAILPQGYGYDGAGRCPALDAAGRCSLHQAGKPAQCAALPLDPLLPDAAQGQVLAELLAQPMWRLAGCIRPGPASTPVLFEDGWIAAAEASAALRVRRDAMAADKAEWGHQVFRMLSADWPATAAALARLPAGGFLALPLTPAVAVLAGQSNDSRQRAIALLHAQIRVITADVAQALVRRDQTERPMTRRLRAWAAEYAGLAQQLERAAPRNHESALS